MKTEAFSPDSDWIHPKELRAWQAALYRKKYRAGHDSYRLHYAAALRGNKISRARMDMTLELIALARLKGKIPSEPVHYLRTYYLLGP